METIKNNRFTYFGSTKNCYCDADWTVFADAALADTSRHFRLERGFTGHEHYTELKIINMNGRLYDPVIARFFSPDNFVQAPESTQGYNRYSYCLNNPLQWVDPSGERFGDDWFKDPYGNLQWFDTHESHITVGGVEYENVGERIWAWTDDYKWYVYGDENGNWHYQKSLDVVDIRPIISHVQQSSSQEFDWSPVQGFLPRISAASTVMGWKLENSNASVSFFDDVGQLDLRYHPNGEIINPNVKVMKVRTVGRTLRYGSLALGLFDAGISYYVARNSSTKKEKVNYYTRSFLDVVGVCGKPGFVLSLYYSGVIKYYPDVKKNIENEYVERAGMMKQGYIPVGRPGMPFR